MRGWIVVDLGFGDSGKGTTTDFLVRDRGAGLVVRFNGGAQAGHTVVLADGRHHTFAQLGAGSFVPGVGTHLTDAFVLHPGGMLVEDRVLAGKGVGDALARTTIDRRARVVTPFQQAAGRLRELLRGDRAHGTTGIGVGEAVADALAGHDDAVIAADLESSGLRAKLVRQQERKRAELRSARGMAESALLDDVGAVDRILDVWAGLRLRLLDPAQAAERIGGSAEVVFEGAQGVLLDETWGFHPHTTWSDCTFAGALRWAGDAVRLGVIRAYGTRHGPGPFPAEDPSWRTSLPEAHNEDHGWQGAFRVGPLDGVLLRYAAAVAGPLDGVVVTCVDRVERFTVCTAYALDGERIERLDPGSDLADRERLGHRLRRARPVLHTCVTVDGLFRFVEDCTGCPVVAVSRGPTAADKRWLRNAMPAAGRP